MKLSEKGFTNLKASEAYRAFAYPDVASQLYKRFPKAKWGFKSASEILASLPAEAMELDGAPWTVGYGQTIDITQDSYMEKAAAEINLRTKIGKYEAAVMRNLTVQPTQGQFDALVQLAWNVMSAVSATSSIIKAHNRRDWLSASRAFGLYNKAKGKVEPGLTLRRQREGAEYLEASPRESVTPDIEVLSSAVVEPERKLAKSEINIASTAAGGVSAVAAAAEAVNSVAAVKAGVATLADWAIPLLLVAVVCLCAYIVLQRKKQRDQGWA